MASGLTTAAQVGSLTVPELLDIQAAYAERLFREVKLPNLETNFANVDDDRAKEIIREERQRQQGAGVQLKKTVRDVALEILVKRITPEHMLPEPEAKPTRPPVLPLDGISRSAARGLVQAVKAGLVSQANWLSVYAVYERVRVTAGDREP